MTYAAASRDVEVEETGHWELADGAAQATGASTDGGAGNAPADTPKQAKHLAASDGSGNDAAELPQTGDPSSLASAAAAASMGAAAILAAMRARRKRGLR